MQEHEVRRSTRAITQLVRLINYERFHNQLIDEDGDMIEEAMMVEYDPFDLNQAMKSENHKEAMKNELKETKKNQA